jgi:hypothetical protein
VVVVVAAAAVMAVVVVVIFGSVMILCSLCSVRLFRLIVRSSSLSFIRKKQLEEVIVVVLLPVKAECVCEREIE